MNGQGGWDFVYDYWNKLDDEKKEEKKDFNRCPKCNAVMDILFNVRKCPICDKPPREEEDAPPKYNDDDSRYWQWHKSKSTKVCGK